jgi:hypothetical protein
LIPLGNGQNQAALELLSRLFCCAQKNGLQALLEADFVEGLVQPMELTP